MYEKYVKQARKAIFCARRSALDHKADSIKPEHLLVGVLRADPNTVRALVSDRTVDPQQLFDRLRAQLPPAADAPLDWEIPLSAESKQVLAAAHRICNEWQHAHVGVEHMVIGMLRQGERSWWKRKVGIDVKKFLIANGFRAGEVEGKVRAGEVDSSKTAVDDGEGTI